MARTRCRHLHHMQVQSANPSRARRSACAMLRRCDYSLQGLDTGAVLDLPFVAGRERALACSGIPKTCCEPGKEMSREMASGPLGFVSTWPLKVSCHQSSGSPSCSPLRLKPIFLRKQVTLFLQPFPMRSIMFHVYSADAICPGRSDLLKQGTLLLIMLWLSRQTPRK